MPHFVWTHLVRAAGLLMIFSHTNSGVIIELLYIKEDFNAVKRSTGSKAILLALPLALVIPDGEVHLQALNFPGDFPND